MLANKTLVAPDRFALIMAEIPDRLIKRAVHIEESDLAARTPADGASWKTAVAADQTATRQIGGTWVEEGRFAVLVVPSAVVRSGRNLAINPRHEDFAGIAIRDPLLYEFDQRLLYGRVPAV